MYPVAMLFVTLMSIYAYRFCKYRNLKDLCLFTIFSLASAYTHYYALIAAGIENLFVFVYLLIKEIKNKSNDNFWKKDIVKYIISAIIQIALYIQWFICFIKQYQLFSTGFWIPNLSLNTFLELFCFQFTGTGDSVYINKLFTCIAGIIVIAYTLIIALKKYKKDKKDLLPGIISIGIYLGVILIATIASIKHSILYSRYIMCIMGLFIFYLSYFMARGKNKIVTICMCGIILIMSISTNYNLVKVNYSEENSKPISLIRENICNGDVILVGNNINGFVITANFPEYITYFYNEEKWNAENSYKAYGDNLKTIYDLKELKDYSGRIWIIDSDDFKVYNSLNECYSNLKLLDRQKFNTKYHNYTYSIALVEKEAY